MKYAFCALTFVLVTSQVHAQRVQMEFGTDTALPSEMRAAPGAMIVTFGLTRIARHAVEMKHSVLRVGAPTFTREDRRGRIISINSSDRTTTIRDYWNGMPYQVQTLDLAADNGCNETFCVGEPVLRKTGLSGKVAGFYADGAVVVNSSWGDGLSTTDVFNVIVVDACSDKFCTGDKVAADDRDGKVAGFAADGTVYVWNSINGMKFPAKSDRLTLIKPNCTNVYIERNDVCPGKPGTQTLPRG